MHRRLRLRAGQLSQFERKAHAFNLRLVPYAIIGSVAVAIHLPAANTTARTLNDLDIVIKPAEEAGLRACMAISSLISGSSRRCSAFLTPQRHSADSLRTIPMRC